MDGFRKLPRRFRWPWRTADEIRGDVDEEIAFHLDMRTRELMREGLGPEEARVEALREFGDVESARRSLESADEAAERRRGRAVWLGDVCQDVHYATRTLRKGPGFAAVAIATLALGIGATTAIFSVVDGVILTPLPFEEPDELVAVWEHNVARGRDRNVVSPANYIVWTERAGDFEHLAALGRLGWTLTGTGEPRRVGVVSASASLFPMLGVHAEIGRVYTAAEDIAGAPRVAVLSHGFWERHFGGDSQVVGRTITLNGGPTAIIGVLPPGFGSAIAASFHWGEDPHIWVPWQFDEHDRTSSGRFMQVLGRLKPGITIARAQERMTALAAQLAREAPDRQAGWGINVMPLHVQAVGDVRKGLLLVLGAVTLVLLIACANVANLLLVRATSRRRELAVRAALGANRWRTVRQLLTETVLLTGTGGLLGVFIAWAAVRGLLGLAPNIPRLGTVGVDASVLAFALVVSLVTGLAFGLMPALRGAGVDLTTSLKESSARGGPPGPVRIRAGLAVAEISLSLVLLVGAGLLIRSFANLIEVDLGFDPDQLLVADVLLEDARYVEPTVQARFFDELVGRARRLPGVRSASAITWPPLEGGAAMSFWANGRPAATAADDPAADMRWVDHAYHRTMGIPLLAGRFFDETDTRNAPLRVVISRQIAETFWPNESAVGKSVSLPWEDTLVAEIIGVVDDMRDDGPTGEPTAMLYWHHEQFHPFNFMSLVVRTTGEPLELARALRAEVSSMDPDLPLSGFRTMESAVDHILARQRFAMLVLGVFALVALSLASVGIYGVVAYTVRQRSHEFGIRMALGAGRREIVGLVLKQGARLVAVALAAGGAAAWVVSGVMQDMVFEIGTSDPLTFLGAVLFIGAVALLASYIPARRAAGVDPMLVLRDE